MNKLVAFTAVVVLALAGQVNAELLENRDFEDGLNDWSHWGSGSGSGSWGYAWLSGYADVAPSGGSDGGQYALLDTHFLDPNGYMSSWGWVYLGVWSAEDEPMTTGDPITFRGKAIDLLEDGEPDTVSVNVEYFIDADLDGDGNNDRVDLDGNGVYEGEFDRTIFDFPLTSEGNWEEFGASMTVPPSLGQPIELVRLFWYIGGTGIAGLDELSFDIDIPGNPADFDGDGDVDGNDFLAWQAGFPTASGASKGDGDYDNDGDVDGNDFLGWQGEFPSPGTGEGSAAVPEPASVLLLIAALVGWVCVKRRN